MKFNIAIDGPSAAGKSTIAKRLAAFLGYIHLDTGAMYRCVALAAKREKIELSDTKAVQQLLCSIEITFDSNAHVYLNNEDVTKEIRTPEISALASRISALFCVREDMVARQQAFAKEKGIIMDGRDIGTVVLPDAELKIFLTASAQSRAKRRFLEEKAKGNPVTEEEILHDINQRDLQDSTRTHSPLRQADDAVLVDTSDLSIEETVEGILHLLQERFQDGGSI